MNAAIKRRIVLLFRKILKKSFPILEEIDNKADITAISSRTINSKIHESAIIYPPHSVSDTAIGRYTYIARNATISMAKIGSFCSIGPNFLCGWGIHPTNGISTSPMFYSTRRQNGTTLSASDKVEERKPIVIGNDVFIGANVTILDGVTIGDGAVIGAGAVVSKDIPPYAVAVGCPIRVVRYRFTNDKIDQLEKIRWWDGDEAMLRNVERYFFDVDAFLAENGSCREDTERAP